MMMPMTGGFKMRWQSISILVDISRYRDVAIPAYNGFEALALTVYFGTEWIQEISKIQNKKCSDAKNDALASLFLKHSSKTERREIDASVQQRRISNTF